MDEYEQISPDGLWQWDGMRWLPRSVPAASKPRPRWMLSIIAGVLAVVAAVLGLVLTLGGWWAVLHEAAQPPAPPSSVEAGSQPEPEDWVVVTYDVLDGDPAMMILMKTELAANRALERMGAGYVDGNEVGQGIYESYYVGYDRETMWKILKPVLADGSVAWTKVELLDGLDDEHPIVVRPAR